MAHLFHRGPPSQAYQQPQNLPMNTPTFLLRVIEARNLKHHLLGSVDPFLDIKVKGHLEAYKGKLVKNTTNPMFNDQFAIPVHHQNEQVIVRIFDKDRLRAEDLLGQVKLPVQQYLNRGTIDEWRPLTGKKGGPANGEVHIVVTYNTTGIVQHGQTMPQQYPQQYPAQQYPTPGMQTNVPPQYYPGGVPQHPMQPAQYPQQFPQSQYPPGAYPQQFPQPQGAYPPGQYPGQH